MAEEKREREGTQATRGGPKNQETHYDVRNIKNKSPKVEWRKRERNDKGPRAKVSQRRSIKDGEKDNEIRQGAKGGEGH